MINYRTNIIPSQQIFHKCSHMTVEDITVAIVHWSEIKRWICNQ